MAAPFRALLVGAAGYLLAACAVGPDYLAAPTVAPKASEAMTFRRAGAAQPAPPASEWWRGLNDPMLSALIERALAQSPTLEAAEARLRRGWAVARKARADRLPTVAASGVYLAAKSDGSSASKGLSLELYNLGANASWELDLFGRISRAAERDTARAQADEAELADVQVTLIADLTRAYVTLRESQSRLEIARQASAAIGAMLDLTRQRRAAGEVSDLEVLRLEVELQRSLDAEPALIADIAVAYDQVAVLAGQEPGTLDVALKVASPVPAPPTAVTVGDPATLLRRRPDIRAAERRLAAATAGVGVATAELFPSVSLTGLIGMGGAHPGDVFDTGKLSRLAAPMLSWNILDFGRVRADIRGAKAGRDEALANYRTVVLGALQDAEAGLSRFDAARAGALGAARTAATADRALRLSRQLYEGGSISLIDQLDVQRKAYEADDAKAQADAKVAAAYAALQSSLGLGWRAP